jgi:multicomponent Na+:H+ antiporter subunit D
MDTIISIKPLLAVLVSTIGALLIISAGKNPNLRESWSIIAGVLKLGIVLSMVPTVVYDKKVIEYTLFKLLPGIDISFRVDAFGLLFALGAALLWIATSFYSIGYMRSTNEKFQTRYFACFAVSLSTTIGVAFSTAGFGISGLNTSGSICVISPVMGSNSGGKRISAVTVFLLQS